MAEKSRWELQLPDEVRRLIAGGEFADDKVEPPLRWLTASPVLSRRLLDWCNSPMFNASRAYESIAAATALMDSRELIDALIVAAVRDFFKPELQVDLYSRGRLWSHSAAVGSIASMIMRTCQLGEPSLAFIAGALHDIGLLASERLNPSGFADLLTQVDQLSPISKVETEVQGWNHAELGARIAQHWGLCQRVQDAVEFHHSPDLAPAGADHKLINAVALANFLCSRAGWSSVSVHNLPPPSQRTLKILDIDADLLTVLWQQLPKAVAAANHLQ